MKFAERKKAWKRLTATELESWLSMESLAAKEGSGFLTDIAQSPQIQQPRAGIEKGPERSFSKMLCGYQQEKSRRKS